MDRTDPKRTVYLNSVTLRTALMESYLASRSAISSRAVGIIVVLLGASHMVLGAYLGLIASRRRSRRRPAPSRYCAVPDRRTPSARPQVLTGPKDEHISLVCFGLHVKNMSQRSPSAWAEPRIVRGLAGASVGSEARFDFARASHMAEALTRRDGLLPESGRKSPAPRGLGF